MQLIDILKKKIESAATHNPDIECKPHCILWPDKEKQWEPLISRIRQVIPQLLTLGPYDPDHLTGSAIWIRCALANQISEFKLTDSLTPVIYLPGIGRQDLRAVETCPEELKPIAELQFRGVYWSQLSTKDWTVLAFLKSEQGGLGLNVSQDQATKDAMLSSLIHLLSEDYVELKKKRLNHTFFNSLITGTDNVKDLLVWMNDEDAFRKTHSETHWKAYNKVIEEKFNFSPESDGLLAAATKLAEHQNSWETVWDRFCEAPVKYGNIPGIIRQCEPPELIKNGVQKQYEGWPQINEKKENILREDLNKLHNHTPGTIAGKLELLEKEHGERAELVWAELGEAKLAEIIGMLSDISRWCKNKLNAGEIEDLIDGYASYGWQVDSNVIRILSILTTKEDIDAVNGVIRAVYLPWLEDSSRYLQKKWRELDPGKRQILIKEIPKHEGGLVLFVDGLRYDMAKELSHLLAQTGHSVSEHQYWAALPSVTGTGKPAVSPIREQILAAKDKNPAKYEPVSSHQFKKLLNNKKWNYLGSNDSLELNLYGEAPENIWMEFGNLDHEGHDKGQRLPKYIGSIMEDLASKVKSLLQSGYSKISIVTDHGWLFMPGGLPKIELPAALAEVKWGRCAVIKPGAHTDEDLYPWHWDQSFQYALANGISCYKKGEEYAHGGLSFQECYLLALDVNAIESSSASIAISIDEITWKGLRCSVQLSGKYQDLLLDVRKNPGNPDSSLCLKTNPFRDDGNSSVVIVDEDIEGKDAFVVIINSSGNLVAQRQSKIGG